MPEMTALEFPEIGLSIAVPADWTIQSDHFVEANRRRVFDEARVRRATLPFLCVTQRQETGDTVNPTFQALYRPSPDPRLPSLDIMNRLLPAILEMFDGEVTEGPSACVLDGEDAAFAGVRYALAGEDMQFEIAAQFWIIARGEYMLMLSGSEAADEANGAESEFSRIIGSIRLNGPEY